MRGDDLKVSKERFVGLTDELEKNAMVDPMVYDCQKIVEMAIQLREMLTGGEIRLTNSEKLKVMDSLASAKVNAFMQGTRTGMSTMRTLDTISNDMLRLF